MKFGLKVLDKVKFKGKPSMACSEYRDMVRHLTIHMSEGCAGKSRKKRSVSSSRRRAPPHPLTGAVARYAGKASVDRSRTSHMRDVLRHGRNKVHPCACFESKSLKI